MWRYRADADRPQSYSKSSPPEFRLNKCPDSEREAELQLSKEEEWGLKEKSWELKEKSWELKEKAWKLKEEEWRQKEERWMEKEKVWKEKEKAWKEKEKRWDLGGGTQRGIENREISRSNFSARRPFAEGVPNYDVWLEGLRKKGLVFLR